MLFPVPIITTTVATWKWISAGQGFTCGISSDDTGYCWGMLFLCAHVFRIYGVKLKIPYPAGSNIDGKLGGGTTGGNAYAPAEISSPPMTWYTIAAGYTHAAGLRGFETLR